MALSVRTPNVRPLLVGKPDLGFGPQWDPIDLGSVTRIIGVAELVEASALGHTHTNGDILVCNCMCSIC